MRILFLTPWYPSEKDAMSGLFVQKHVEAVRMQGADVRVIFSEGWRDTWRQWRALRREGWMPDVVQLNVIQKQGALALWLKERYGIPYVIVEHWSGYLPENGMFRQMSMIKQGLYRLLARKAEVVLTVSQKLQQAMKDCGVEAKKWGRVDNVVDDFFYSGLPQQCSTDGHRQSDRAELFTHKGKDLKTLLHVSCFDERAKNVKGLLRAAKMLSEKRQDWQLVLVGTGVDYEEVRAYAESLELPEGLLHWRGELTPREVAEEMQRADALVLSSRYETYGVVLAEAAAAGLPILSTPVGIAEDTGALIMPQEIAQNKAGKFAEFIETILWNTDRCTDRRQNTELYSGKRYSAETIGKKLIAVYDSCLHHDI